MKAINFLVITVAIFLLCACQHRETTRLSDMAFAEGDLVFRRGNGVKSRAVLHADSSGVYSHSGMIVLHDSAFMVVHITPGERAQGDTADVIKMETPQQFFASQRAKHGAVYRLKNDSLNISKKAAQEILRLWKKSITFDHDYNLDDSTQMYCTELIYYAYSLAGKDITDGKRSKMNAPMYSGTYIFPSDIYKNSNLILINKF
ncbi:MAG: hypothetical protein LBV75_00590 [Paludibacter sp.]|nr:hypothetical protein [Paludibacter sp.]